MKTCTLALLAVFLLGAYPVRAGMPIEEPNYNDPEDALMAIQDLQTVVGVLARERGLKGYADQCDLAVRDVETHAAIYGVPERADLRRGWMTCHRAYSVLAPDEEGTDGFESAPAVQATPQHGPTPGQPLDAPPDYLAKPSGGE